MKAKKRNLNDKMKTIILSLHKKGGAMSAHELSTETGLAYNTVQKYLITLEKMNIIHPLNKTLKNTVEGKRSQTLRYSLNYDEIFSKTVKK